MKLFSILLITFIVASTAYAVLENNKLLIKEIENIENTKTACIKENPTEKTCGYNCALNKLDYKKSALPNTASYRGFCERNTTTIENECIRSQEFVYCLHREVQKEMNKLRDDCVAKHHTDMQAYRNTPLDTLVNDQSYACFMFCFQKAVGKMNDDLTLNFSEETLKRLKFNVTKAVEDCTSHDESLTLCSKAAHLYYCLEDKLHN